MEKFNLSKAYKSYYSAKNEPELVQVEAAQFLSVRGKGDPSEKIFELKIKALYSIAYAVKFILKARESDFIVAKLEALWWFDEEKYKEITITEAALKVPRAEWEYRLLIRMPDFVTREDIENAIETVFWKKKMLLAREVELFSMNEGKSVQMLHTGPFNKEVETLAKMNEFMQKHKLMKSGLHHEIYLSDFAKTAPGKLKTILREPIK
ncbi:GyrI-like domain-containing protein [Rubrolithibacter danxiaensis]|uniref:GyrI-like domain-containing protein n=1 Tax=Rubrolithibacter danxiaensis TaxID=3390805 RepID=UPI003BF8A535